MSEALIAHSVDLQRLQSERFVMEVCDGHLVVHHIPYVNDAHVIKEGTLVMVLCISGDHTVRPNDHTAYWIGEWPCDIHGNHLPSLVNSPMQKVLCKGFTSNFYLSCHAEKEEFSPNGNYPDYYEKVRHYFDMIAGPALNMDSEAWMKINKPLDLKEDDYPLQYMDTNSSKAGITDQNSKFKGLKIGIVGLGGTGSYILDLISKTTVEEIHLFDGDEINTHNAFRAPGAIAENVLSKAPKKVDYFSSVYGNMHKHIVPHPCMVTEENISELDGMSYVFLALDSVSSKKQIARYLIDKQIPFIDSGLGIDRNPDGRLSGMLHIAIGTCEHYQHLSDVMGSEEAEKDMYATDIQIADLNALAADLSVIRWKKMLGFYDDNSHELYSVYTVNSNEIDNVKESKEA